ncbi:MAG: tyrosine-type recombinase/integrase [Actinobacteria bacterium]|nr:tyrosine-type recombinase/integrase [Actinomycetota bacterium]
MPHVEQATLTADELAAFLEHVSGDRLLAAYMLLATTGMRRGEVFGLRWRDVDLSTRRASVTQTVTTVNDALGEQGSAQMMTTTRPCRCRPTSGPPPQQCVSSTRCLRRDERNPSGRQRAQRRRRSNGARSTSSTLRSAGVPSNVIGSIHRSSFAASSRLIDASSAVVHPPPSR